MPPRKSGTSIVSNGAADQSMTEGVLTPVKPTKEGVGIDDLTLPKSMIARLAKGVLPPNTQIQKDALLALHKSATVFVSYIANSANELTQANMKKTIMPQDVMTAIKDTEFEAFLPRLQAELKKYNDIQNEKRNSYRHRVKQEKAAAAAVTTTDVSGVGSIAEGSNEGDIVAANGGEDAERPTKKLKGEEGEIVIPHTNGSLTTNGQTAREEDDLPDEDESLNDDEEEDDDDEEEEEEDDDEDGLADDADQPDTMLNPNGVPDEALDEPDSD